MKKKNLNTVRGSGEMSMKNKRSRGATNGRRMLWNHPSEAEVAWRHCLNRFEMNRNLVGDILIKLGALHWPRVAIHHGQRGETSKMGINRLVDILIEP